MREPAFQGKTKKKWVIVGENKTDVCEYREQGWKKKKTGRVREVKQRRRKWNMNHKEMGRFGALQLML